MKLWVRKITVVLVAIMTLGLYIPPTDITDAESKGSSVSSEADINKNTITEVVEEAAPETYPDIVYEETAPLDVTSILTEKAREIAITKLGPRIAEQLEDEFQTIILPKLEEELAVILTGKNEEELAYYEITENPAAGYGERIFNVFDYHTNTDVAKFHVRRDFRPLEGYWFNFHYHLSEDGFEKHHDIGDLYWDKNMPPKWMS